MDEKILINDLSVLSNSFSDIRSAIVLLDIYRQKVDALNRVELPKKILAKNLDVSLHTISNWLRKLSKAGAIKYKYSGSTILNPLLYFYGTQEDFSSAKKEWENFFSDIT